MALWIGVEIGTIFKTQTKLLKFIETNEAYIGHEAFFNDFCVCATKTGMQVCLFGA